ncbi:MAG: NAD-dependent epimerase/dehydratase family protein [Candidatus Micrarchaeota archaeon]
MATKDESGRVYVTGASGRLGRSVLARLPDAVPLVRKASGLRGELITDFSPDSLRGILRDAKAVIHLAGLIGPADEKRMKDANVSLTWRIVDSLPRGSKAVFASSISVYGKKPAEIPASEKTRTAPDSAYARTKLDAEKIVARHPKHCILRIGTLYGPQFDDYFLILRKIERGKMKIIGNGSNRIPFAHVDDVAGAIANAVERGSGIYVLAGEPLTQQRIYEIAARELGVNAPAKHIGSGLAMLAALFSEKLKMSPTTREHIAVLASDRAFDCRKAREELGFSPRPLEDGIREMVRAYRETAKSAKV